MYPPHIGYGGSTELRSEAGNSTMLKKKNYLANYCVSRFAPWRNGLSGVDLGGVDVITFFIGVVVGRQINYLFRGSGIIPLIP